MNHFLRNAAATICPTRFPAVAVLLFSCLLLVSCSSGTAPPSSPVASVFPAITLTRVFSGFTQPTHITHAGDGSGRIFVVEKKGTIRIVRNGTVQGAPFLNITGLVRSTGSEQGLFSVAFPPGFAAKRHFYIDYTGRTGIGDTVLARHPLTANPDVADSAGGAVLLNVVQPFENHNGGQLAFGANGFLYVSLGDGGSGGDPFNNGQNLGVFLGKILRIDVESGVSPYAIPAGNPFGSEIWAFGLRNPWRFSFDRATDDLYIADVGQDQFEEVNFQPAASRGGENYGWNIMEGLHCFNSPACSQAGLTLPVAEYIHDGANCSVTGGFVYRGAQYPALQGVYLYADLCSGRIWGLRRNGAVWENRLLLTTTLQITTFGEDEAGNLYLADFGSGDIYKIDVP
ncbi:MAG: glucose/sorbosone dehydrogenase-like [Geobacteraceae bacterium]|nr:MAG: glucose/sorbosone dehydrogenase-like [Geobacteraceae bacterium]